MINVEMLSTGDEVLHGQIIDTNAAWLADLFFEQGLPLTRRNTVGDNLESLVAILRERSEHCDVLIVNGGLGPTGDDLSALAAATAKAKGWCCMRRGFRRWSAFSPNVAASWPPATANRLKFPPAPSWSITSGYRVRVCHAAEPLPDVLHAGRALRI